MSATNAASAINMGLHPNKALGAVKGRLFIYNPKLRFSSICAPGFAIRVMRCAPY